MTRRPRILWLLLVVLFAGCTSWLESPSAGRPADLPDIDDPIAPEVLWTRGIGAGSGDHRLGLRSWIDQTRIYVADGDGRVLALDTGSGEVLWSIETDAPLSGGPGFGEELVLIGSTEAEVLALDAATGELRWRANVSSEVLSTPAAALGTVVVHTLDGKIAGLDATTGTERWRFERAIPVLTLRGSGSPIVDGSTAYCGLAGGKLIALDVTDGVPVWEASVTVPRGRSELERLADIDGDPVIYSGVIYVATFQGDVAAVGQNTGNVFWRRSLSSYNGLGADWRQVYVSDAEGIVWALDGDTGAARWRQEQLRNRRLSAPGILDEFVVLGDLDGYVHWLSADDGRILGRVRVGSDPITAPPQVLDGVVYILGDGGELAAVRPPQPGDR
jgi:outer membrane protein assembly factor BamB